MRLSSHLRGTRLAATALAFLACALAAEPARSQAVRWETAAGGNGHYYELVTPATTWAAARAAAALRVPPPGYAPGHLLTVDDDAEDAFVWTTFGLTPFSAFGWIGFTDEAIEGEWRWIDDTPGIWQDPDVFANPIQTAYVNWVGNADGLGDYAIFGWYGDSWVGWNGADAYPFYVEYEPAGPACSNGIDDDHDTLADYPADPGCADAAGNSERGPAHACDDGSDDDGDGAADFPADPGCAGATDDSERDPALLCDDGIDNDGDTLVDHPGDPDCASPTDDSEEHVAACQNGIDDDGDGRSDAPADPGCASGPDDSERDPALVCDDGVDDDADGFVDFPADPGCAGPTDGSEENVPDCSNGIDDDGDGLVDAGQDPQCTGPDDLSETTAVRWTRNGHYYDLSTTARSWTSALAAAAQQRPPAGYLPGHLLTLSDAEESAFVVARFGGTNAWIGFTDRSIEGEWRWIDGTPGIWQDPDVFPSPVQTAYVNWVRGEPNDYGGGEDFAEFPVNVHQRWNDSANGATRGYYVEFEPPVSVHVPGACANGLDDDGDGLVDYPVDPGCPSPGGSIENPQCSDGVDNDGDGGIDAAVEGVGRDMQCIAPFQDDESSTTLPPVDCTSGAALAFALPMLVVLRRRTSAPRATG